MFVRNSFKHWNLVNKSNTYNGQRTGDLEMNYQAFFLDKFEELQKKVNFD